MVAWQIHNADIGQAAFSVSWVKDTIVPVVYETNLILKDILSKGV